MNNPKTLLEQTLFKGCKMGVKRRFQCLWIDKYEWSFDKTFKECQGSLLLSICFRQNGIDFYNMFWELFQTTFGPRNASPFGLEFVSNNQMDGPTHTPLYVYRYCLEKTVILSALSSVDKYFMTLFHVSIRTSQVVLQFNILLGQRKNTANILTIGS